MEEKRVKALIEENNQKLIDEIDQRLDQKLEKKLDKRFEENNEKMQAKFLRIMNLNNDDLLIKIDEIMTKRFREELAPINALLLKHENRISDLEEKVSSY